MVRSEQQSSKRILYPTWKRVQVLKHKKKNPISDIWAYLLEKRTKCPWSTSKTWTDFCNHLVTTKRAHTLSFLRLTTFHAHNISTQNLATLLDRVGRCLTIFKLGPITSNKLPKRAQHVVRNVLQDVALKCYVRVAGPLLLKLVPHSLILYPSLQILLLLRSLLRLVEAVYNQFSSSPW